MCEIVFMFVATQHVLHKSLHKGYGEPFWELSRARNSSWKVDLESMPGVSDESGGVAWETIPPKESHLGAPPTAAAAR